MILHALLAAFLSASAPADADSVRGVKLAVARPDTTVPATPSTVTPSTVAPAPTAATPLPVAVPAAIESSAAQVVQQAEAAAVVAPVSRVSSVLSATPQSPSQSLTAAAAVSPGVPTSASATAPAGIVPEAPASAASSPVPASSPIPTVSSKTTVVTTTTTRNATAPVSGSQASLLPAPVAPVLNVVATPAKPIATPVAAPADASAVAATVRPEAVPAPAPTAPVMTADGRVVLSVKTTVTYEPMHAVPLPTTRARPTPPAAADSIVVDKRERRLTLYFRGVPVRSYFVALGARPVGDKERAGDQRTPEGLFHVTAHNPASKFHLGLRLSYPDSAHRARAEALGVDPGGDIMIHGLPPEFRNAGQAHLQNDWTNGCVALTNEEIEEIWRAVPHGAPVHIKP